MIPERMRCAEAKPEKPSWDTRGNATKDFLITPHAKATCVLHPTSWVNAIRMSSHAEVSGPVQRREVSLDRAEPHVSEKVTGANRCLTPPRNSGGSHAGECPWSKITFNEGAPTTPGGGRMIDDKLGGAAGGFGFGPYVGGADRARRGSMSSTIADKVTSPGRVQLCKKHNPAFKITDAGREHSFIKQDNPPLAGKITQKEF